MKTLEKTDITVPAGADWLIKDCDPSDIFIPEEFTEEQLLFAQTCKQFVDKEVHPRLLQIEENPDAEMLPLIGKAAALDMFGAAIPEKYGGLQKDFVTNTIISEEVGGANSFTVFYICHIGIGMLPILYFGTEEQKEKYLPKLVSGEWIGAYGLTEPGSGSDALSAKTTATLSQDGKHYILNGQKCWITNGGWANIFTVFAKVDGTKFTAFLVEKNSKGFSIGHEEKKIGIKGSSTTQLYFQDCVVPVENVLGEIGKGHIVAFNILNVGRFKMAPACIGGGKRATNLSLTYAMQRKQFNKSLVEFGLIKQKLADMAIQVWVCETATYRLAKTIEDKKLSLEINGTPSLKAGLAAVEEYAMECALLKVFSSEMYNKVADEGVQIHGGNGYSNEYPISHSYLDSRINRIFEGTNEINRLLSINILFKRAMNGRLDLLGAIKSLQKNTEVNSNTEDEIFGYTEESAVIKNFKHIFLLILATVYQKVKDFEEEQELTGNLADIAINIFTSESALLRLKRLAQKNNTDISATEDIVRVFLYTSSDKIFRTAKEIITNFCQGKEYGQMISQLKQLTQTSIFNTKEARRRITAKMVQEGKYCF